MTLRLCCCICGARAVPVSAGTELWAPHHKGGEVTEFVHGLCGNCGSRVLAAPSEEGVAIITAQVAATRTATAKVAGSPGVAAATASWERPASP